MSAAFATLLRAILERFEGTKSAFAYEAEITPSALSRLLAGGVPPVPEICLRIAHTGGESPTAVLRAAGHLHTADLIELLYGKGRAVEQPLTHAERSLVRLFRRLSIKERRAVLTLIKYNLSEEIHDRPRQRSAVRVSGRRAPGEKQSA